MSNRRKPKQQKPRQPEPIDFDAVRAQKRRTLREVPPIRIGGKNYTLPNTIPLAVTDYFAEAAKRKESGDVGVMIADMQALLRVLFGDEQWDEIATKIDMADVPPLFQTVFTTLGESVGESSNSGQS